MPSSFSIQPFAKLTKHLPAVLGAILSVWGYVVFLVHTSSHVHDNYLPSDHSVLSVVVGLAIDARRS